MLRRWASKEWALRAGEELLALAGRQLPQEARVARAWHAVFLRRDVRALTREIPMKAVF